MNCPFHFVAGLSPRYFGTLPFSFMAWLTYSVYLSAKIGVIFSSNIPGFMTQSKLNKSAMEEGGAMPAASLDADDPIHSLGTNLLKVRNMIISAFEFGGQSSFGNVYDT